MANTYNWFKTKLEMYICHRFKFLFYLLISIIN